MQPASRRPPAPRLLTPDSCLLTPEAQRLPRPGRYFLLVALVMLGIGVHRNINLLMLLGYVLLVMAGWNLLAARRSVHGLQGRRRLGEWLFARTPCSVEVQVHNPNRRKRWGLRIEDGESGRPANWFVDGLPGRSSSTWRRDVILPKRGRYKWGGVWAISAYPFGLVQRRRQLVPDEDILVLPCLGWLHRGRFLRHLRSLAVQPQYTSSRRPPQRHPAAQAEFHGLRSYHSGDSPRLIHWRTSARQGKLMVREFEDEPSDNLLVLVDPTLPAESDYCSVPLREQFEEVVSLAASICWEWCRRRGDRLVLALATPEPVVLDGVTGPPHARHILEALAVLEHRTGPTDPAVIAALQGRRLPPVLVVVVALGHSPLANALGRGLRGRVNCLDAARSEDFDFYTPAH